MIDRVPYDFELFSVERAELVSAKLGELILGVSRLGTDTSAWVPVPLASFTMTEGYTVDGNGTLIYDSQTATVALSFVDEPGDVLQPGDRVRASYDGAELFLGTVDTASTTYVATPGGPGVRRVIFTATLVGTYATALAKTVCWTALPVESPIDRIRRWVTVTGWED